MTAMESIMVRAEELLERCGERYLNTVWRTYGLHAHGSSEKVSDVRNFGHSVKT